MGKRHRISFDHEGVLQSLLNGHFADIEHLAEEFVAQNDRWGCVIYTQDMPPRIVAALYLRPEKFPEYSTLPATPEFPERVGEFPSYVLQEGDQQFRRMISAHRTLRTLDVEINPLRGVRLYRISYPRHKEDRALRRPPRR